MCNKETIQKIDNGTHIVIPKKAGWFLGILGTISPLAFVIAVFSLGSFKEKSDTHMEDSDIHMTYKEQVEVFVPRSEVEYKLEDLNEKMDMVIKELNIKH